MSAPSFPDKLPVQPILRPGTATVTLPGSKSITNRALILAALARSETVLSGALFSRDTQLMADGLRALGFRIVEDQQRLRIVIQPPVGETAREASLVFGNSGTTARFLTALLATIPGGTYHLDGDEAMRRRPMRGLFDALTELGAIEVTYHESPGLLPATIRTQGLPGGRVAIDASASSQLLSAMLMIAPLAREPLSIRLVGETVSHPFIRLTLRMMEQFGQTLGHLAPTGPFTIAPQSYDAPAQYPVEPDATAASYFFALPFVAPLTLHLPGLDHAALQGDIRFADVMRDLGLSINESERSWTVEATEGLKDAPLDLNFTAISDTFLTLAALAPLRTAPMTLRGLAHTRHQETDRLDAMATELRKLGCTVTETEDSITIVPNREALVLAAQKGVRIETYEDHRVAMSFGILGCVNARGDGSPWLTILDPSCVSKTFPHFFTILRQLIHAPLDH